MPRAVVEGRDRRRVLQHSPTTRRVESRGVWCEGVALGAAESVFAAQARVREGEHAQGYGQGQEQDRSVQLYGRLGVSEVCWCLG